MKRGPVFALTLAVAMACASGCSSPSDEGGLGAPYPSRTSPARTVEKLRLAYEGLDVEAYLDCLAADFTFFLNPDDVAEDPSLEPGYWDKAEERTIHENMFGSGTRLGADSIEITLTQVEDPLPVDPGDGTGTHWQYKEYVDLRVHVGDMMYWTNCPTMFELRIDQDETGPHGEELWEICDWYDLDEEGRRAAAEASSWGMLKAWFR